MSIKISDLLSSSDLLIPDLNTRIKNNIEIGNKKSWAYFSPFLIAYNLYPKRSLYLLEDNSADIVFQYSKNNVRERIDLIIPPFNLNNQSLNWIDAFAELISNELSQDSLRIMWVDEDDKNCLSNHFGDRLVIEKEDQEYIYDIKSVVSMIGSDFKDLRKSVNKILKMNPKFRKMEYKDTSKAMELLKFWRKSQGRKNDFLLDWGYTKNALMIFSEFSKNDLYSWCIEIDNKMVGFAMAGPMTKDIANFFIIKTDTNISGLSLYLRWRVLKELTEFSLINDASDLGIYGLKQHKMKLRPVEFNTTYTISIKI